MMEIVIDIPEKRYKDIQRIAEVQLEMSHFQTAEQIIAKGVPIEQEPALDKVRNEIAEYGSIWVAYAITGHSDRDIENLIEGVLKQAKEQVLNIIDKYKAESKEEK